MTRINNDHSGDERLHATLSSITIQPDAEFKAGLHANLAERRARLQQSGDTSTMIISNQKRRLRLAVALGGLVLAASLAMTVPQVRAMFGRFFVINVGGVGTAHITSEITPVYPADIPERFNHFATVGGAPGTNALEIRYFNQSEFIVINERLVDENSPQVLPEGDPVQVGPHAAVIQRDLSGEVRLMGDEPQAGEWAVGFGGGGGGGGSGPIEMPPEVLPFSSGLRVVWVQDELWLEVVSNLPEEELLAILGGTAPAEEVEQPDGAFSVSMEDGASAGSGGGGGGNSTLTQFALNYLPKGMQTGGVVGTEIDGQLLVENHEYGPDNFIVLTQTQAAPDDALPGGETIMLDGGYIATLETGLSGTAYLAGHLLADGTQIGEPFPYPPGGEPPGWRESADYTDGIRLTWFRDGVRLVLLTDLPLDEAIRVAEGILPAIAP